MAILPSLFKSWGKRLRNRAFQGPMSDLSRLRREVDELHALAGIKRENGADPSIGELQKAVRHLRDDIRRGSLAFAALESRASVVDATEEERTGDVTRCGALGYPSWESSVSVYRSAFRLAIDYLVAVRVNGPIAEFGTCTGFTARQICDMMNERKFDQHLWMYDSFEGLPETTGTPDEHSYEVAMNKVWGLGAMAVPAGHEELIRRVLVTVRPPETLHIVKGFYEHTLETGLPKEKCSLVHIDCDIYTSAIFVLNTLAAKNSFQDGCIVMFDDWNCNRANPNMGVRRAMREFLAGQSRWTCSQWFHYGWNGMAFIMHDGQVTARG